ncbi:MAG: hypothetical protein A2W90_03565 [Bacteroidetes bacterium GWF2_42_66]|nr:MAG: hypothetical protein A2W89_22285 [Bacteroidetes bacterium GWE2_42_39]OFY41309.1 MAG: hypothetical protein A2W90_03565 [Bacteroidetes bacterium GWF2_42_66]HBL75495.1 hypothetical protein [Prolixibacteraceae bacterium]HCU60596.1 hypothetical protein [Prolixibacteraceae bacterium]
MSYLFKTAKKVEKVFSELDKQIATFQNQSGLHCAAKCNLCCMKKDLETSVLEFLPLAVYLYENNLHEQFLDELAKGHDYCVCLSHLKVEGKVTGCTQYEHRGLICRLFGFSGLAGKTGEKKIYTCKVIKTGQAEEYQSATARINTKLKIPMASDFQMKMDQIDPSMANDINLINVSIEKAILKVAYYYSNSPGKVPKAG